MTPGFMGYPLIGKFKKDFLSFASGRGKDLKAKSMFLPEINRDAWNLSGKGCITDTCGAADLAAFQEGIQGRQLALGDHHRI